MLSTFFTLTCLGLVLALPSPQLINLDGVAAAKPPVFITAPVDVASNTPTLLSTTSVAPITTDNPDTRKRSQDLEKRDGTCDPQPSGPGPVPSPDTPSAFLADPTLQAMSTNALTPYGYAQVFVNLQDSLSASNYMGLYTLNMYDTSQCQSLCDQASSCQAFNIYIERDPSLDPNAENCPNPPSTINYKCTLWGAPVSSQEATNAGQYHDGFDVLITGSNAYNKNSPPPGISGFNGPVELGGAINAPLYTNGYNTFIGYQYFPFSQTQGFTPQTCADACTTQTQYNSQTPAADCSYEPCVFFNAYVLSDNGVPQGLYCTLYNETWGPSYATNYGQTRGSDEYAVSDSYSYSVTNPVSQPAYDASCVSK
ncbi:hypothetical protein MMC12_006274 [Toensbergia leucococca]|nr:hypothetical protein [Toensbergia leucococca]